MIGPEDDALHLVVPGGDRAQHGLHLAVFAHVAAGEKGQRAETDGSAQHLAPVDLLDQPPVFLEDVLIDPALGPEDRA